MDFEIDVILGSITWRRIGVRWSATFHGRDGFVTVESDSEEAALNYAMLTSFLLAP
jgi:hypothetical protein